MCFNPLLWRDAFDTIGLDPAWYAHRERPQSEVFPWAHLHGGADQECLSRQYEDVFTQINMPQPDATAVVTS
jgi:hypothetical protein